MPFRYIPACQKVRPPELADGSVSAFCQVPRDQWTNYASGYPEGTICGVRQIRGILGAMGVEGTCCLESARAQGPEFFPTPPPESATPGQ